MFKLLKSLLQELNTCGLCFIKVDVIKVHTRPDTDTDYTKRAISRGVRNIVRTVRTNRRLTVREVAEEVSISKTVCHEKKT
jgi:hypothetical protein